MADIDNLIKKTFALEVDASEKREPRPEDIERAMTHAKKPCKKARRFRVPEFPVLLAVSAACCAVLVLFSGTGFMYLRPLAGELSGIIPPDIGEKAAAVLHAIAQVL
ncbi:hypothetical protein K7I13_05135 [Brucepastera parasyntrophica]|uniref:hypothetical protein n=1 Tax=Brucepastera parasyntrophica TaxID=2880008 RepID=UPI00210D3412|nr:hypothetical protein [Brucepastera parasyntrophica]ULQ60659.1 hypothetical protein K7I13_05135 [Brucepastera parasyntrophica]